MPCIQFAKTALSRLGDKCSPTLARFRAHVGGNIAVTFAIALLPILSAIGGAVDYTNILTIRSKLEGMQDMAVLSALSRTTSQNSASQAQSDAIAFFNSLAAAKGLSATISLNVTDANGTRTVNSTFSSVVTTTFMKVVGYPTMTVWNTSTGQLNLPSYIDFYLLLDNTPSMGLGATMTDIQNLQTLTAAPPTSQACAFACHIAGSTTDNYAIAKNNGVTMRIDVVRQATQQLTDTATANATMPNQYRMGVYTFGSSCTSLGVTTVAPLSSNMSSVKSAAGAIDLMTIPYQNYNRDQCTDFDGAFSAMNGIIPSNGPGTSANPQKYLFYVSDGVGDANYPSGCSQPLVPGDSSNPTPTRCQEPLSPSDCAALKARGVTIAVLYTTYLPLDTTGIPPTDGAVAWYINWIKPFSSQIATNMQTCASPGFYFEVSPTQGISDAMNKLFQKAVAKARLTG